MFGSVSFAFQTVLFGLFRTFFIIGGKKDAVCMALMHVFWITADRAYCSNFVGASPFHQIGWVEPYCKKAFVRLRILMLRYSITLSAKEAIQPRLAQILRKILAKTPRIRRNEQTIPPIMKNKRPNAGRNLLKRERYRAEHKQLHQIPNWGRATAPDFNCLNGQQTRGSKDTRRSDSPGWKS